MSELPDGLPNTCLDCLTTSCEELGNNRFKLTATKDGKSAVMLTSLDQLVQPMYDELTKVLENQ